MNGHHVMQHELDAWLLTFGMWWVYYLMPSADVLRRHRDRAPVWGYVQMLIVTSIVATGAGLHLAAYFLEGRAEITAVGTVLSVAVPVLVFLGLIHALYAYLVRRLRALDAWLLIMSSALAILAVVAAWLGVSVAACLVILVLAPATTVVVYEVWGYRHQAALTA